MTLSWTVTLIKMNEAFINLLCCVLRLRLVNNIHYFLSKTQTSCDLLTKAHWRPENSNLKDQTLGNTMYLKSA